MKEETLLLFLLLFIFIVMVNLGGVFKLLLLGPSASDGRLSGGDWLLQRLLLLLPFLCATTRRCAIHK